MRRPRVYTSPPHTSLDAAFRPEYSPIRHRPKRQRRNVVSILLWSVSMMTRSVSQPEGPLAATQAL